MPNVKIVLMGAFSKKAGMDETFIDADADFTRAVDAVKSEVVNHVGDKSPYAILVNGESYTLIDPASFIVKDGDIFVVLPIMAGG